jgi:hypothetical protein
MINALFNDVNMSLAGTYTPAGGSDIAVRVIKASPKQEQWGAFQTHASVTPYVYDVRVSEVAVPKNGDVLVVDGMTFIVRSAEKDSEQLAWRLNLDKQ